MNIEGKTIAVTGASGMLGVYICRALLKKKARVIGVVRDVNKAAFLKAEGVEFRKADLMDVHALEKAFDECDAIVSNAALYRLTNFDWESNYQANKIGTENVFVAAAKNRIQRAIQISTVGLYQFNFTQEITERSMQVKGEEKEGGAYRATKQLSEALAWKLCNEHAIRLTTLRPSAVYGARDTNIMPYIKMAMLLPFIPMPALGWPFVYADDVAHAVTSALENDASVGEAYNTAGDHHDFADFLEAWHQASGKGANILKIPLGVSVKISNAKAERDLNFQNRRFVDALKEIFSEEPSLLA